MVLYYAWTEAKTNIKNHTFLTNMPIETQAKGVAIS